MERYIDIYPESLSAGNGLIYDISMQDNVPWFTFSEDEKKNLERFFSLKYSKRYILDTFSALDSQFRSKALLAFFNDKWSKLLEDYKLQYDIISPYDITESIDIKRNETKNAITKYGKIVKDEKTTTENKTSNNTESITYGKKVDETSTDSGTINSNGTETSNRSSGVYGYNSSSSVPSDVLNDETTSTSAENRDLENNRNITNSGTDEKTYNNSENISGDYTNDITNSGQDENSDTSNIGETNLTTKKGNIGYSTYQDIIKSDILLWETPFFDIVFNDIINNIGLFIFRG